MPSQSTTHRQPLLSLNQLPLSPLTDSPSLGRAAAPTRAARRGLSRKRRRCPWAVRVSSPVSKGMPTAWDSRRRPSAAASWDSSCPVSSMTRLPWLLRCTATAALMPLLRRTRFTAAIPLLSAIHSPPNSAAVSCNRRDVCRNCLQNSSLLCISRTRNRRRFRQAYSSSLAVFTKARRRIQRP